MEINKQWTNSLTEPEKNVVDEMGEQDVVEKTNDENDPDEQKGKPDLH